MSRCLKLFPQFCATRKGTQQAANTLVKDARFVMNSQHRQRLLSAANSLKDTKLKGEKSFTYTKATVLILLP